MSKIAFADTPHFVGGKNVSHKKVLQIITNIAQTLHEKHLIKSQEKIVLTISGGQDSNCLLYVFCLLRKKLLVDFNLIWCNHFWQTSSFFTMLHVAKYNFCCSSTILFFLPLKKVESEKVARDWRYKVIQRTALFYGSTTTAQAHTKSDRIETILFNLIRGTGLTGIATLPVHSTRPFFSYNKFYPIVVASTKIELIKLLCFYNPHVIGINRNVVSTFSETTNIESLLELLNYPIEKNRLWYLSILESSVCYIEKFLSIEKNQQKFEFIKKTSNTKLLALLNKQQVLTNSVLVRDFTDPSIDLSGPYNFMLPVRNGNTYSSIPPTCTPTSGGKWGVRTRPVPNTPHLPPQVGVQVGSNTEWGFTFCRRYHGDTKWRVEVKGIIQYENLVKNKLYIPNYSNYYNQLKGLNNS